MHPRHLTATERALLRAQSLIAKEREAFALLLESCSADYNTCMMMAQHRRAIAIYGHFIERVSCLELGPKDSGTRNSPGQQQRAGAIITPAPQ